MPLWRIHPVAPRNEAHWQGRKIWKEVLVRAPSAAMARLIACELDRPAQRHRKGNETLCFRSGLEDAKLYWAERLDRCGSRSSNEREGVVHAVREDGRAVTPALFDEPSLKPQPEVAEPAMPRAA